MYEENKIKINDLERISVIIFILTEEPGYV